MLLGQAPLGARTYGSSAGGGGGSKSWSFDWVVVNQHSITWGFDWIILVTSTVTWGFDWVISAGGLKVWAFDWLIVEPYHDYGAWHRLVGNENSIPVDKQRIPKWSNNTRPSSPLDNQWGINVQNSGKIEYWDAKANKWKMYDGTDAP